jgi:hypothetical protein
VLADVFSKESLMKGVFRLADHAELEMIADELLELVDDFE